MKIFVFNHNSVLMWITFTANALSFVVALSLNDVHKSTTVTFSDEIATYVQMNKFLHQV
jgi:hypothetical protein